VPRQFVPDFLFAIKTDSDHHHGVVDHIIGSGNSYCGGNIVKRGSSRRRLKIWAAVIKGKNPVRYGNAIAETVSCSEKEMRVTVTVSFAAALNNFLY
jgi:hypothetical protein